MASFVVQLVKLRTSPAALCCTRSFAFNAPCVAAAARFPLDEVHKALVEAQFGHKGKVFLEG